MNNDEKCEFLKGSIQKLYEKEGRSISYISRILEINRKNLGLKIKAWGLVKANIHYMTPSNKKFIDSNRDYIKSQLDKNVDATALAKKLNIDPDRFKYLIKRDTELKNCFDEQKNRLHNQAEQKRQAMMDKSAFDYNITPIEGEVWKECLGFSGYFVSNKGRVKHYSERYKSSHLLKSQPNKNSGRLYISMTSDSGKPKNIILARLVAKTFCDGWSEEKNTVNHIDGDINNNCADNLEWVSRADNNLHAYRSLHRNVVNHRTYKFKKIIYKSKYEFKTVTAFAKFIGKSETQTRRYIDEPEKHDIKLVS